VKFDDLAKDFLNDYRINGKRSLDKAERSVRHLEHFLGGMRAVDITTDKVRTYVRDRHDIPSILLMPRVGLEPTRQFPAAGV
jgi:hypothetical protein